MGGEDHGPLATAPLDPPVAFSLHEHGAAPPAVLRVRRIARAPDIAHTRHAAGRAAAKDGELERHEDGIDAAERGTFLNRRKKLSVVAAAMSSALTPRTAASPSSPRAG